MNTTPSPALLRRLLACACLAGIPLLSVSVQAAAETAAPRATTVPALPVSHSFSKAESVNGTPFVLTVKNDSKTALKLSGHVLLSVVNHAMDKARKLPEHTLEAGASWSIAELAGDDKVVLNAEGHAPLEIRVPFKL